MTTKTKTKILHVLIDGTTVPRPPAHAAQHPGSLSAVMSLSDQVCHRGDELELSPQFIAATTDRYGGSWTSDLSDEAQLKRWGQIRFGSGPTPDWLTAELADEAQSKTEADRIERVREQRRFGKRVVVISNGEVVSSGVQHD